MALDARLLNPEGVHVNFASDRRIVVYISIIIRKIKFNTYTDIRFNQNFDEKLIQKRNN